MSLAAANPAPARSPTRPIARALQDMGYTGTIGLEGFASDDPEKAIRRFRDTFTI